MYIIKKYANTYLQKYIRMSCLCGSLKLAVSAQTRLCVGLMTRDGGAVLSGREAEEGRVRTSDLRSRASFLLQGSGVASTIRATAWQRQRVLQTRNGRKFAAPMIWNKQPCGSSEAPCELCMLSLKAKTRRPMLMAIWHRRTTFFHRRHPHPNHSGCWRLLPAERTSSKLLLLCSIKTAFLRPDQHQPMMIINGVGF